VTSAAVAHTAEPTRQTACSVSLIDGDGGGSDWQGGSSVQAVNGRNRSLVSAVCDGTVLALLDKSLAMQSRVHSANTAPSCVRPIADSQR
jgi:hypothetical protein